MFAASSGPVFNKNDERQPFSMKNGKLSVGNAPVVAQWAAAPPLDCSGKILSVDPSLNGTVEIEGCPTLQNPAGPPAIAIKMDTVVSVLQLNSANLVLADTAGQIEGAWPQLVLEGTFQSEESIIHFGKEGNVQVKNGGSVDWRGTNFTGIGNISVDAGVTMTEVSACSFGERISWLFNDIRKTVVKTWRNNEGSVPALNLRLGQRFTTQKTLNGTWSGSFQCDKGKTGAMAGCDVRAVCADQQMGGVKCMCGTGSAEDLLIEADASAEPGIQCRQGEASDAFIRQKFTTITVQKPLNASLPRALYTAVKGERHCTASIQSDAEYIEFVSPQAQLLLSASMPEQEHAFGLNIIGTMTKWPDSNGPKSSVVTVSTLRAEHQRAELSHVNVSVDLKPYPSCTHTQAKTQHPKTPVMHTEGAVWISLDPRDFDNLPISRTQFKFRVYLQHQGTLVSKTLAAGNDEEAKTLQLTDQQLTRPGKHSMKMELLDGWDHGTSTHGPCTILTTSFNVVCSAGYKPSILDRDRCILDRGSCGDISGNWRVQGQGEGSAESNLTIHIAGTNVEPDITIFPVNSTKTVNVAQSHTKTWDGTQTVPVGTWMARYVSDSQECAIKELQKVTCSEDSTEEGGECVKLICKRGREVKIKQGSCEQPQLKATIKSKSLDIGYLEKKNLYLHTQADSPSRIIQVEPSAEFGVSSVTHTMQVGQGQDSWVQLSRQIGTDQSLFNFQVDFNASGISDSTQVTATMTFKGKARDYYKETGPGDVKAVAENITLQAHVFTCA